MKKSELQQIIKEEIDNGVKNKIIEAFKEGASYVYLAEYYDREEVEVAAKKYAETGQNPYFA
jgi:hypothetical protein